MIRHSGSWSIDHQWEREYGFADGGITSGGITDRSLTITITIGRRRAAATTNILDDALPDLDPETRASAVERAVDAAMAEGARRPVPHCRWKDRTTREDLPLE